MRNGQRWELYKLSAQNQPHLSCLRHFRGLLEYMQLKKTKLVLYSKTLKSVIGIILREILICQLTSWFLGLYP